MEITFLKGYARKASNEDLLDIICFDQFSGQELGIFKDEVKARGLENVLAERINAKERTKNEIKAGVSKLPKEDLVNIICYNRQKFTEDELLIFKNEAKVRGIGEQLDALLKAKAADDLEFKKTVLSNANDPLELLTSFNAYTEKKYPDIAKHATEIGFKKRRKAGLGSMLAGVALIIIGLALTIAAEGGIIFYGAVVTGIVLLVKGIIAITKR